MSPDTSSDSPETNPSQGDNGDHSHDEADGQHMPMPDQDGPAQLGEGVSTDSSTGSTDDASDDKPKITVPAPSFVRQMAQLFIIPALICAVAFGVVTLLMNTMSRVDNVNELLDQLARGTSGQSGPMGLQSPAYKERCRVAMNLAVMLGQEGMEKPQRAAVGQRLMNILKTSVREDETKLRGYMLLAIAQTGPPGGVEQIISHANSDDSSLRFLVARSLSAWPQDQREQARTGISILIQMLSDQEASVASEASRVLGIVATPDDVDAIEGLKATLAGAGPAGRDVRWNAAMALARLGQTEGYQVVAKSLLNREHLKTLAEAETGPRSNKMMSQQAQAGLIIRCLIAFPTQYNTDDNMVWKKIDELAKDDPDVTVRKAAQKQRMARKK